MTGAPTSDRPPHRDEAEDVRLNKLVDIANIGVVVFTVAVVAYLFIRSLL